MYSFIRLALLGTALFALAACGGGATNSTAPAVVATALPLKTPTPAPTATPTSNLYAGGYSIDVYKPPFSDASVLTNSIAVDGGRLIISGQTFASCYSSVVSVYASVPTASSTPAVFTPNFTATDFCGGLAFGHAGGNQLFYLDEDSLGHTDVLEFDGPFSNATTYAKAVAKQSTAALGIAFDSKGQMVVANTTSIDVYAAPYTGSPVSSIALSGSTYATSIAMDYKDNVYAGDGSNIDVYTAPVSSSSKAAFSVPCPNLDELTSNGYQLICVDNVHGTASLFSLPLTANSKPFAKITDPNGMSAAAFGP
jgi:hypothetical protein